MVVLSLIGILLAVGVPTLGSLGQINRRAATTNEIVAALQAARSEAVKLNQRVTICKSKNGADCDNAGRWDEGWIIFSDANGDRVVNGGDRLLRVQEKFDDNQLAVVARDNNNLLVYDFTFTSRGLPKALNGTSLSGAFSICSYNSSDTVVDSRAVILSLSGKVRSSKTSAKIACPASP